MDSNSEGTDKHITEFSTVLGTHHPWETCNMGKIPYIPLRCGSVRDH